MLLSDVTKVSLVSWIEYQKLSVLCTGHRRNACGLQSFLSPVVLSLWSERLMTYCSVLEKNVRAHEKRCGYWLFFCKISLQMKKIRQHFFSRKPLRSQCVQPCQQQPCPTIASGLLSCCCANGEVWHSDFSRVHTPLRPNKLQWTAASLKGPKPWCVLQYCLGCNMKKKAVLLVFLFCVHHSPVCSDFLAAYGNIMLHYAS